MTESIRVQAEWKRYMSESIDLYRETFSRPSSFVRKQGDLRGEREIGEATHADFFALLTLFFGLFCFVSLDQFIIYLRKFRLFCCCCPNNNFIQVFCSLMMDIKSGYKNSETVTIKKHVLVTQFIYPN